MAGKKQDASSIIPHETKIKITKDFRKKNGIPALTGVTSPKRGVKLSKAQSKKLKEARKAHKSAVSAGKQYTKKLSRSRKLNKELAQWLPDSNLPPESLKAKNKLKKQVNNANRATKSSKANYVRKIKASNKKAKASNKIVKPKNNRHDISSNIKKHKSKYRNEGNAAIYASDGSSSKVIYIAPTDTESEDNQSNVTTYPVDKGAPYSNYARVNSKTVTVSGIISAGSISKKSKLRTADNKYKQLRKWNSRHTMLTYKGNIYYKHLIISDLQKSHSTYRDNIKVSITFTFAYRANITSPKDGGHSKKSKSAKTLAGSRNKNYTAITIKPGDTLLGLAKKYNTTVSWLQKVNKIKNPNLIYAGKKLYTPKKQTKSKKVAKKKTKKRGKQLRVK